jgi:hypothetical protein
MTTTLAGVKATEGGIEEKVETVQKISDGACKLDIKRTYTAKELRDEGLVQSNGRFFDFRGFKDDIYAFVRSGNFDEYRFDGYFPRSKKFYGNGRYVA